MEDYTVLQVATITKTTTQNIYKKLDFLIKHNLAYRNIDGKPFIKLEGLNYITDKQSKMQQAKQLKKINTEKREEINKNMLATDFATVELQIKELKQQVAEWKQMYISKDNDLKEYATKQQKLLDTSQEEKNKINKEKEDLIRENENYKQEILKLKNRNLFQRLFNL